MTKVSWTTILPANATAIVLPHPDIQGPYTSTGEECPWPWEPIQLKGAPMGMYHCGYCGEMVMAGEHHIDYGPVDENGLNAVDRDYAEYMKNQPKDDTPEDWDEILGGWESEGGNGTH